MALELLVTCTCGHTIATHEACGCMHRTGDVRCRCVSTRDAVVETLIDLERADMRARYGGSPLP